MSELAAGFESLAAPYQDIIRLAQERFNISVMPLQALSGGWSGANIYLVSVRSNGSDEIEHYVLKLDRKNEKARSDEIQRHQRALNLSPPEFAAKHLPRMVHERLEQDGVIAIFYDIAGQSLHQYRPLSAFERQSQLETLFTHVYHCLLDDWNAARTFRQAVHPQALLKEWLGFRLQEGGSIEKFLHNTLRVPPDMPGLLIQGSIFPNPLAYARSPEWWGSARPLDVATGLQHGDLNTNNILAKFDRQGQALDGFYLIDFALFKEEMPLFFDLRYLEISYLVLKQSHVAFPRLAALIASEADLLDARQAPVEVAGVSGVTAAARETFRRWVEEKHSSLRDDLWAQYRLAGVAAGLSYTHKAAAGDEERLAGLIFAAANLKGYAAMFGLPTPPEGREIFHAARWNEQKAAGPVSPSPTSRLPALRTPNNLPAETSTFVGRKSQVAAARELLAGGEARLVSLTGPGGVGKTRLSLQTAARLLDHFPDGVFFVPLAEVTDLDLVVSKIARTLEVREGGSQPLLETLKDYLHGLRLLLVLDNLEQVVTAAPVLVELLSAAPELKILATSRVVLQVRGEHDFPVPPLDIPDASEETGLEALAQSESVRLFVERAQAADPRFVLTAENAPAVVQICCALDGLPLAIELAAARVRLLPPKAMLARLSNRLALLTGGARDLPARQQTLRGTLDWSYSLLSKDEQSLLACLSVFSGGFTLAAAEAVCFDRAEGAAGEGPDVMNGVEGLLNHSLLRQDAGVAGHTRFTMLETVREYALDRLAHSGGRTELERRHALYYIKIVGEEVRYNIYSPDSNAWMDWLESEHDNIRAALGWSLDAPDFAELAEDVALMIDFMTWFWYRRGYFSEGRAWAERVLAKPALSGQTAGRAWALQSCALLAMWQGDLVTARTKIEESLRIMSRIEDEVHLPIIMMATGVVYVNMGSDSAAHPLLTQTQALAEQTGNGFFYATTLVHLGNVALGLGRTDEARGWLETALAAARSWGEPWVITFALNNLGEVARVNGDWPAARRYYEESETLLRAMGDKGDLARLVHNLGYVAFHEEDYTQAEKYFSKSLALFQKLSNRRGIAECLAGLASLKAQRGHHRQAVRLLGAADALLTSRGAAWWPADRVEVQRCRAAMQAVLGEETFQAEWLQGHVLPLEQAVQLARSSEQDEIQRA